MTKFGETVNDQDPDLGDLVTNYKLEVFYNNREHKRKEKGQSYSLHFEC